MVTARKKRIYPSCFKVNAFIIILTCSFHFISWALPGSLNERTLTSQTEVTNTSQAAVSHPETLNQLDLKIPEAIGKIEKTYSPNSPGNQSSSFPRFVIHIQDAHANYEAQKNIQKLLEYLTANFNIDSVFVEGGMGEITTDSFHFFDEPALNEKTADLLAKKGLIGGTELFLVSQLTKTAKRSGSIYGVENPLLYKEDLKAFKAVYDHKDTGDQFLKQLETLILTKASYIFNKRLNEFFREWTFLSNHQDSLASYLKFLQSSALKDLDIDFGNAENQSDWPYLVRLFKMNETSGNMDDRKAEAEKIKLIEWLRLKNIPDTLIKNIEAFQLKTTTNQQTTPSSNPIFRQPRTFFETLHEAAAPKGFSFADYPNFFRHAGILILQNEIEAKGLYQELEQLTDRIYNRLASKEEEKTLIKIYKYFLLLKKLFSLELTHNEYSVVIQNKNEISPSILSGELTQLGSNEQTKNIIPAPVVNQLFSEAVTFFEIAQKREQSMFENMASPAKTEKPSVAILVTGGFHSAGLQNIFEKNAVGYAAVSPRFSEISDKMTYIKAMTFPSAPLLQKSYIKPFWPLNVDAITRFWGNDSFTQAALQQKLFELLLDGLSPVIIETVQSADPTRQLRTFNLLIRQLRNNLGLPALNASVTRSGRVVHQGKFLPDSKNPNRSVILSPAGLASAQTVRSEVRLPSFRHIIKAIRPQFMVRTPVLTALQELLPSVYAYRLLGQNSKREDDRPFAMKEVAALEAELGLWHQARQTAWDLKRYVEKQPRKKLFLHLHASALMLIAKAQFEQGAIKKARGTLREAKQEVLRIPETSESVTSTKQPAFPLSNYLKFLSLLGISALELEQKVEAGQETFRQAKRLAFNMPAQPVFQKTHTYRDLALFFVAIVETEEKLMTTESRTALFNAISDASVKSATARAIDDHLMILSTGRKLKLELPELRGNSIDVAVLGEMAHERHRILASWKELTQHYKPFSTDRVLRKITRIPAWPNSLHQLELIMFLVSNPDLMRRSGEFYKAMKIFRRAADLPLSVPEWDQALKDREITRQVYDKWLFDSSLRRFAFGLASAGSNAPNNRARWTSFIAELNGESRLQGRAEVRIALRPELLSLQPEIPSPSEIAVATSRLLGNGIFRIGRMPERQSTTKAKHTDLFSAFPDQEKAANLQLRISMSFDEIPSMDDLRLQILIDFLSHNQTAIVQILLPEASNNQLRNLERTMSREIANRRQKLNTPATRGVKLNVTSDELKMHRFITSAPARALVFDSRNKAQSLLNDVLKKQIEALLVNDNALLKDKGTALLTAIYTVLERPKLSAGITTSSALMELAKNLEFVRQAQAIITQAA
ncbi:MAG: hypothetical protein A3G33_02250 [Omnitrophica bacterium RIFCSPLOWO2_12_FULL_44_17]|uniref:Uncharacterized protein n=1 Tax=Candidatus Danuiimicrobium aquiferis TaxID=1801832 RepID=A0A1G1L273_9BACT|nr:MAG: hypothetical protein A3B72_08765 [Omnitrophica bacterium RIFCSPHIGHO2_02_FULL_45_28]OGW99236.1 MAG: hypothetical protein A3G33_02250 [Omnitrophica bacterium RIFCSPLOWO2_12_FULL_44_17]OGX03192.1 MAG: hypothetical protein A3J12_02530 [Omnitrophica bacterium RIFCSPLOWO2_02_FULL_44_11]